MMQDAKRIFFIWGGTVRGKGSKSKIVHEAWSTHSECIECHCVVYDEKKRDTTQTTVDHFSNRDDRIKSSKVSEPVPSMVSKYKIAAFCLLLLTILQLYHLSPCLPPPVSNSSCLFTQCQPVHASSCTILLHFSRYCSVQFSNLVMSNSLRPHELQHVKPSCPSPAPGVHPNPCQLNQWRHPTTSSSVIPLSSCPQSLLASESFLMSQLFASGGQSIGVSASASVLSMNT